MRAVIQRVISASVAVDNEVIAAIDRGLLVFVAAAADDAEADIDWLARKLISLKLFNTDNLATAQSLVEVGGELMVVSQFTLLASTRKGTRPSWHRAAPPTLASSIFDAFVERLSALFNGKLEKGRFGAKMKVRLENDGPVTLIVDTKVRE